jgi:type IV pilus assembly protein PilN
LISINLLPKHLRRVKEPGYWRLIAVLFPLLIAGVLVAMQLSVNQTERNKRNEVEQLQARRDQLQEFVDKQRDLQAELQNLQIFQSLSSQVKENQINWTSEISSMLETLPAQGDALRPRISFNTISMQAVNPPSSTPDRFDGGTIKAEMNVSGEVANAEVLSEFIRSLENSSRFGVDFQSASLTEDSGFYSYNLTIASLTEGEATDETQ